MNDLASFQAAVAPGQLNMLQPVVNARGHLNEFSWLAVLLGYPILGIWYWCADQTHVQRVLGARSLKDGQNGALFAGFLKITPVFLMVLPGVIGYVLWQKGAIALANVPGTSTPDYNTMLPVLINHLVPTGLRGLLAAMHGGGAHELHGGGAQQLRDARLDGRREARPARHPRRAGGEDRPHHDGRHHGPRHALVDTGRPVRDDLRGDQQDPR